MIIAIPTILILVYLLMIFPRIFRRANMDGLLVDYAHRGLHSESLPENSIGAFEAATEKGIGIELDIQLSKDGIPMVFHDDNLSRVCGIDAPLSKFTADELCQMKLLDTEYTIPTFAETLSVINGRVPILVEFKPGNMELCRRGCDMLDNYNGKFCVESFDSILLGMIRRYRPEFSRGQLVGNMFKSRNPKNPILKFLLTFAMLNFISRPDFIAADKALKHNLSIGICRRIAKAPVFVWTVKSNGEHEFYSKKGYTSIFDNYN